MKYLICLIAWLSVSAHCSEPSESEESCKTVNQEATRLKIIESQIHVKDKSAPVYQIVLDNGAEYLERKESECFNVVVVNAASVPTALHWHGLILPNLEDGVPFITQAPIPPGGSYPYNFKLVQRGTYFAHSHYGLQEQKLMSIPIILHSEEESSVKEIVASFEDFSFDPPQAIWVKLRKKYMRTRQLRGTSWKPDLTLKMDNMAPDLYDVAYDAFLTNRKTIDQAPTYTVQPGEEIRLRLINASAATQFLVTLGHLLGSLVAVDGNPIEPVEFDQYPLATGQRIDILVTIPDEGAYPIIAQGQGTKLVTGFILKTEKAPLPQLSLETTESLGAIDNAFEKKLTSLNPLPSKNVDRYVTVELQGNMPLYLWALNNKMWPNIEPITVKEAERVELTFTNKTAMSHPMHLHGHVFQIVQIDDKRYSGAIRDTVLVMPNQTVKVQFDANNPGIWPLHCHILYHAWAGMLTVVQYEGIKAPYFAPSAIQDYSKIYGGY